MKKRRQKKYAMYFALAGLAAAIILTIAGGRYYIRTFGNKEWGELRNARECTRYYVMIPDDSESALWQDIYKSAQEEAEKNDVYVELLCGWRSEDYSTLSYMDIAETLKVDGIIVKPDGTSKMAEAIDKANAAGIPVVTILNDDTASSRKSFVGVNSYQMGITYGRQILECIDTSTETITILMDSRESGKELIFKEIKATIQEGLPEELKDQVQIQLQTIKATSTFEAEEAIRDLFVRPDERPDILVCMSEVYSECACHAVVDYNQVGDIVIIGSYCSEAMLNALRKGTVMAAVTLNTEQMGQRSIEALEEYYSMGYTSSYFSVDLDIITKENVDQYRKKSDQE